MSEPRDLLDELLDIKVRLLKVQGALDELTLKKGDRKEAKNLLSRILPKVTEVWAILKKSGGKDSGSSKAPMGKPSE